MAVFTATRQGKQIDTSPPYPVFANAAVADASRVARLTDNPCRRMGQLPYAPVEGRMPLLPEQRDSPLVCLTHQKDVFIMK